MGLRLPEGLRSRRNHPLRRTRLDLPGCRMSLCLNGNTPAATCECGHRCYGDSLNDAVLAWAKHVTRTPACREKL